MSKAKKKKPMGGGTLNPPFDPRMMTIGPPSHNKSKFRRGWIVGVGQDSNLPSRAAGRINFMYNPPALSVNHSMLKEVTTLDDFTEANSINQDLEFGNGLNIGTTGFELLFDRSYELWDRDKRHTWAGRFGCYADVLAFYQFFGITGEEFETKTIEGGAYYHRITETMWQTLYPSEFMQPKQMYVYLSDKLRFYGYATSLDILYSHFNKSMVPVRCKVVLYMNLLSDEARNPKLKTRSRITRGQKDTDASTGRQPRGDQPTMP